MSYYRLLAVGLLIAGYGFVNAAENTDLKEEISDLRAKVTSLESSKTASVADGDAQVLNSTRKKGQIAIGGDVNTDIIYKHRDDRTSEGDEIDSTEFTTNSANLRFKISANENTFLYIKLDVDDFWDSNADQDDLLEEAKFVWNDVRNSGWGFVFGKGEVPYGQDKTIGVIQSFHHNDGIGSSEGPAFILAGTEAAGDAQNPHANVGNTAHPGEVDNVFMAGTNFIYKNILKFEFAVFQNSDDPNNNTTSRGMHEDRSNDNLGFQSFAARLWLQPTEGLQLQASFIREYCDSAGDKGLSASGQWAEDDQYAFSFGFAYDIPNVPLEIFGEYQHGWDWNYKDDYDTDTYQLGVVWTATHNLSLGLMGEWLSIDDGHADSDEDYARVIANARYDFDTGIFMILEYGHEWYDGDFGNAADRDREGDLLAFRMGWAF